MFHTSDLIGFVVQRRNENSFAWHSLTYVSAKFPHPMHTPLFKSFSTINHGSGNYETPCASPALSTTTVSTFTIIREAKRDEMHTLSTRSGWQLRSDAETERTGIKIMWPTPMSFSLSMPPPVGRCVLLIYFPRTSLADRCDDILRSATAWQRRVPRLVILRPAALL